MMDSKSVYLQQYRERELIGRGNFGTATLVESTYDKTTFVAKKVVLGNLNQKEIDSAQLEVKLLRELRHPHIVSYKECFIEEGVLITIMEYCQVLSEGDLKQLITKMAEKGERFNETQILNWFLQILLALEFIHRKKILHRDIKTSNVFLKSDGTVKVGDFGISKSLENTNDRAFTVVGTPYYMSPEVCENKPYTLKSDVWALGCVLYEMCTLQNAFTGKNLLGLIYKIVRDDFDPLPSYVSPEMAALIGKLLTKNENERPSIIEVMKTPIIQKAIKQFISTEGDSSILIKVPFDTLSVNNQVKEKSKSPDGFKAAANETIQIVDLIDSEEISRKSRYPSNPSRPTSSISRSEALRQEVKRNQLVQNTSAQQLEYEKNLGGYYSLNTRQSTSQDTSPSEINNKKTVQDYQLDHYQKQLRNVQRLIPKRQSQDISHRNFEDNLSQSKSKFAQDASVPSSRSTVSNKAEEPKDMEKEMFDLTQESMSLSMTKGSNNPPNQDNDDDLMGTCMSQDFNAQIGKDSYVSTKSFDKEKTLKESWLMKQSKSSGKKVQKNQESSDEYEEDFEEEYDEYEEDFEEYTSDGEEGKIRKSRLGNSSQFEQDDLNYTGSTNKSYGRNLPIYGSKCS